MNSSLEFFNFQAGIYDLYQRGCVPRYDEMTRVSTTFLAHFLAGQHGVRILDLGCGTGNSTEALLKLLPGARFTCMDGSESMLAAAKGKLVSAPVEFHCLDLEREEWPKEWEQGTFDAAISVLVLEHLTPQGYRRILAQLLRRLKPNAWFVAVEGYSGEPNQTLFFGEMNKLEKQAVADSLITRNQLQEVKKLSAEKERHYFADLDEKKRWWIEAGFVGVTSIWQYYCVAALVGRKPA